MTAQQIKVAIADDHKIFRDGILRRCRYQKPFGKKQVRVKSWFHNIYLVLLHFYRSGRVTSPEIKTKLQV